MSSLKKSPPPYVVKQMSNRILDMYIAVYLFDAEWAKKTEPKPKKFTEKPLGHVPAKPPKNRIVSKFSSLTGISHSTTLPHYTTNLHLSALCIEATKNKIVQQSWEEALKYNNLKEKDLKGTSARQICELCLTSLSIDFLSKEAHLE